MPKGGYRTGPDGVRGVLLATQVRGGPRAVPWQSETTRVGVEQLAKDGISVTPNLVYFVLGGMKGKAGRKRTTNRTSGDKTGCPCRSTWTLRHWRCVPAAWRI
jgi:hypothetical protein